MVEALVVGIRVEICERLAVERSVAQANDNLRLDVIDALVVSIEGVLQVVGHLIVERLGEHPFQGGALMGLFGTRGGNVH